METLLTRCLSIWAPVIQAPMAGVSGPELAARVACGGGCGLIAMGPIGTTNFSPVQAEGMWKRAVQVYESGAKANIKGCLGFGFSEAHLPERCATFDK